MSARAAPVPRRKSRLRAVHLVSLTLMLVFSVMFWPTAVVLAVGMLPAAAAYVFDQDSKRATTMTVALMNASGTLPFIIELWTKGQTLDHAMALVREPVTWLVMYGAAGIGWLICFIVPHAVQLVLAQRTRMQITDIENRQAELRQVWGEDVRQRTASP